MIFFSFFLILHVFRIYNEFGMFEAPGISEDFSVYVKETRGEIYIVDEDH